MKPGNTPLVEFRELAPAGTRLFAKLEWYNPTGSIKDRPAWHMFHKALEDGHLTPGTPLIEATSGNTGIGLARIALINKHPMTICLPSTATEERKQLLRAYGANLIEVEGGPNDAIAYARRLVAQGEGYMCYQYGNPNNPAAHEYGTSVEIQRDWPLEAPPDHLFCAYGTGGTITGNSRAMKRYHPDIKVHSVEPFVDDPIGGMRSQEDAFQPPVADLSLVDNRYQVTRSVAEDMVLQTMNTEGHFVGTSSGAIIHAALTELETNGGTAVILLPDAGWKYLSGNPWQEAAAPPKPVKSVEALAS
jgi:cysteine synthase B